MYPEKGWFTGFNSLISYDTGEWAFRELGRDGDDGFLYSVESVEDAGVLVAGSLGVFYVDSDSSLQIEINTTDPRPTVWIDLAAMSNEDGIDVWMSSAYDTVAHIRLQCSDTVPPSATPETPKYKPFDWHVYLPAISVN